MSRTFEQGWAARPFKEQFPELSDKAATHLDRLNRAITDLYMADMLTDSQVKALRERKMPKAVLAALRASKAKPQ